MSIHTRKQSYDCLKDLSERLQEIEKTAKTAKYYYPKSFIQDRSQ